MQDCKRAANERWGARVSNCYRENKKMFWKEVNSARRKNENLEIKIKDENGNMLTKEQQVRRRWSDYFDKLLNDSEEREAELSVLGRDGIRLQRIVESERISVEEVEKALKKMKSGKASGVDGVGVEMLKEGGESMIEWLVRIYNVCLEEGNVPDDWKKACVVPLYKGKGERSVCSNYRGISLLSVVGKVYGRVLIERVKACTESQLMDVQGGFRDGRGCVDQVFALKAVCEKYLEVNKSVYLAFMDLEKAYDKVDRCALWNVLRMYGVEGKLMKAVKSFYEGSEACVRIGRKEGEWFPVKVGLRQG